MILLRKKAFATEDKKFLRFKKKTTKLDTDYADSFDRASTVSSAEPLRTGNTDFVVKSGFN